MKTEKILKYDYLDILFENRNKGYGAYVLRKKQNRHLVIGFLLSCFLVITALMLPYIIAFFQPDILNEKDILINVETTDVPKGTLTPFFIPPPPPHENVNTPPKVVKDKLPDNPKVAKKPETITDATVQNAANKDTTQTKAGTGTPEGKSDQVFLWVERRPTLTGNGYASIQDYIGKNTHYPEIEKILGHQGQVVVTATVNIDGTLSDVHLSKRISPALDNEALRIVKSMPRLNPGIRNGQPVRVYMRVPVDFQLSGTALK